MGIDPITATLAVAGTGLQMYSKISGGNASRDAAYYRAQVADNNAATARANAASESEAGSEAVTQQGLKTRAAIGAIKAGQASNNINVETGSAAEVRTAAAALGELDALTIRHNAAKKAHGYQVQASNFENEARLDRVKGDEARRQGYLGAFSSLIQGASTFGSKFNFGGGGNDFQGNPWGAENYANPTAGRDF